MEANDEPDSLVHSNPLDSLKNRLDSPSSKVDQIVGPIMDPDIRRDSLHKSARNLGTLQEESDGVSRSSGDLSRTSLSDESMGNESNDAIVKVHLYSSLNYYIHVCSGIVFFLVLVL